jgi:hypothetical protein
MYPYSRKKSGSFVKKFSALSQVQHNSWMWIWHLDFLIVVFRQPVEIKIDIGDGVVETRRVIHNYMKTHAKLRKITVESYKKLVHSHFSP